MAEIHHLDPFQDIVEVGWSPYGDVGILRAGQLNPTLDHWPIWFKLGITGQATREWVGYKPGVISDPQADHYSRTDPYVDEGDTKFLFQLPTPEQFAANYLWFCGWQAVTEPAVGTDILLVNLFKIRSDFPSANSVNIRLQMTLNNGGLAQSPQGSDPDPPSMDFVVYRGRNGTFAASGVSDVTYSGSGVRQIAYRTSEMNNTVVLRDHSVDYNFRKTITFNV